MVTTNINPPELELPEKRITLHNISWEGYEQILDAVGESRAARVHYYRGMLEIMTPLEAHENSSENIGSLIHILTEELNLNIKSMAATTLNVPSLQIGVEPDKCYYIQNETAVRGKTVDLTQDPPPDLILEVDITHTDINKKQLYQEMQVPEFWRYNGKKITIYLLEDGIYVESETSKTLPILTKSMVYDFLTGCRTQGETQTKRVFRRLIQTQIRANS